MCNSEHSAVMSVLRVLAIACSDAWTCSLLCILFMLLEKKNERFGVRVAALFSAER